MKDAIQRLPFIKFIDSAMGVLTAKKVVKHSNEISAAWILMPL